MLKQRIFTACILIPIFLAIVFYSTPPAFLVLTALMTLAGSWEWAGLMGFKKWIARFSYLIMTAIAFFGALFVHVLWLFGAAFVFWLLAIVLVANYPRASNWWGKSSAIRGLMGLLVLVPCWAAINFIRNQDGGVYVLFFVFVLIWSADTAAYFVGRKWGKTKLAPRVSPGKSIQGVGAAMLSALIVAGLGLWIGSVSFEIWPWGMMLSLITVLFSILGDLFESMLKRQAGVKDSSQLLPGHGGVLDRIDSLTAAAPVFALGGLLIGTYF